MSDEPFYLPNRKPAPPRQPHPVKKSGASPIRQVASRRANCGVTNDSSQAGTSKFSRTASSWVSRRYAGEKEARFAAEAVRQDLARTGWA